MARFKVVFFDLDGTLWDTLACSNHVMEIVMPSLLEHLQSDDAADVIRKFNAAFLSLVREHGMGSAKVFSRQERFEKLFEFFDVRKTRPAQEISHRYDSARRLAMRSFVHKDVPRVLDELGRRGVRRGLITDGTPAIQQHTLQTLGLKPYFDYVLLGEIEGYQKPDVRLFRRALEVASVEPPEALHVGDSPITDVLGAHRAGMPTAWYRAPGRQWRDNFAPPDHTIEHMPQLLSIVGN